MKIAITGARGYVGSTLYKNLSLDNEVTSITRNEVDLTDYKSVDAYFADKQFDVVIHSAITGGSRLKNDTSFVLDSNIKMYYNLLDKQEHFSRFISIGSGAELYQGDTPYGLSKHVIRQSMLGKDNFYNVRVFAVFDENELDTRFIKGNIKRYIDQQPIIIHQNKYMDFFYMQDFISVIRHYIKESNLPKEFDCTYDTSHTLLDVANKINSMSDHSVDIVVQNDGVGNPYVGKHNSLGIDYAGLDIGIQQVYNIYSCKI